VFGFIILSIFDARYGIADFDLFRAKIMAAGTMFALILALPVFTVLRGASVFRLKDEFLDAIPANTPRKHKFLREIDEALLSPFVAVPTTWFLLLLFTGEVKWEPKGLSYWLLLTAIITAILMWRRRWFDRRPYIGV